MSKTNQRAVSCSLLAATLIRRVVVAMDLVFHYNCEWEIPGGPYEDDDYDPRDVARDCLKQGDLQGGW